VPRAGTTDTHARTRAATLADVGRLAGVSPATASRVLNGTGTRVAETLRARVVEAAEQLDYVPNAHAQALMRRDSRTVGVLAFDVANPYFTEITSAIFAVANETGRLVTIGNIGIAREAELSYIALLRSQRVGALILAASGRVDPVHNERVRSQLNAFRAGGGRVALIGRHEFEGDCVRPDNVGGGRAAAQALLDLGHTEVGVLTGSHEMTVVLDRLSGFSDVFAAAGHPITPERIVEGYFLIQRGYEAMARLLEQAPQITAVFCLNDGMALGAMRLLRERGIDVPGQISVVGFEDITMAREVWPALSTVHVPLALMGETAMKMLLDAPAATPRTVHLPTELCLRATTAPPARR
jgi:LacI family transcriptional regulator, galactose operon repressor